jgi:transposase InsO family protein/transposase-like protein
MPEITGREVFMFMLNKSSRKKGRSKRKRIPNTKSKGRRFTKKEKEKALQLIDQGITKENAARQIGTTPQSVLRWEKENKAKGTISSASQGQTNAGSDSQPGQDGQPDKEPSSRSVFAPLDPGNGLADYEVEAILDLKKKHPSYQPAQIRAQLKRFKGWRIAIKSIARVFKQHGFSVVHRGSRPEGPEPIRFEAPRRNALWQMDWTEIRMMDDKLYLLLILDDFSRYITGHCLSESPTGEMAIATLKAAIARHGKPEALRTDRGGCFVSYHGLTPFGRYLEQELIDHIVGKPYKPQGGGKIEAAIGALKREFWNVSHISSREEAKLNVANFIDDYNHRRAHMGIDGLTPSDRFFGRADKVLSFINALSRKRQGALSTFQHNGSTIEEVMPENAKAPLEVLRFVIVDGIMELRFCGARIKLGPVDGDLSS